MLSGNNLDKLTEYLRRLGYTSLSVSETISAFTAITPVLASISLRIYQEKMK